MSDLNNNNINNISLFQNSVISSNNHSSNINYNINDLYLEEFKLFFRKYVLNQRKKEIDSNHNSEEGFSDSDSCYSDIYNELNNIYLKCFKNLNQFLKENQNSKGVRLEGNKLLENISLEQFNELFSQYGKGIKKKFKTHVLNYFYPNNNKPKLMGQQMQLTPIPVKKQIYLKNQVEKKDYKNAERAAVIMRRLEYTHGLGNKKTDEEKIFFYLMKGAVLIIEDWWIKIMNKRGNFNIGNKNKYKYDNIYNNNNNNNESSKNNYEDNNKNKYIFQMRPKSSKRTVNYNLKNKNINNSEDNKGNNDINKIISNRIKPTSTEIKNNNIESNNKKNNKNIQKLINCISSSKKDKNPNKNNYNYNLTEKKIIVILFQII